MNNENEFLLQEYKNKKDLPFNFIYFKKEEIIKKRTIKIEKYQTDSFVPHPNYKSTLFYLEDEQ